MSQTLNSALAQHQMKQQDQEAAVIDFTQPAARVL
jgi:hypothetical protein